MANIFSKLKNSFKKDKDQTSNDLTSLFSYGQGLIADIEESSDQTFASKVLGDGLVLFPADNKIYAPQACKIEAVFPSKHALNLSLANGLKLMIHCGIDTVELDGQGFEVFVKEGQEVKKGDLLLSFDEKLLEEKGYKTETMLILLDLEDGVEVKKYLGEKNPGDRIINIKN